MRLPASLFFFALLTACDQLNRPLGTSSSSSSSSSSGSLQQDERDPDGGLLRMHDDGGPAHPFAPQPGDIQL